MLPYIRGLESLFYEVERSLSAGGVFAFSTERCDLQEAGGIPPEGPGWVERETERIAHCEEYIRSLVSQHAGLRLCSLREVVGRRDGKGAIRSHVIVVAKGQAAPAAGGGESGETAEA